MRRAALLMLATALLTACAATPPPPAALSQDWPPAFARAPLEAGGRLFRLDPATSAVRIYVFRGGRAARLGHNHLLSAPRFEGWLWWPDEDLARSRGELRLRWDELLLDDPAQRAAAGGAFAAPLTPEAIAATRANLLGPQGVDAARRPELRLRLLELVGEPPRLAARVELALGERRHALDVPLRLSGPPERPRIAGAFVLRQRELGLTPFTVLGGLLAVRDELVLEFELQAEPAQTAS
ncbi:hypothetical protein G8A07_18870 [Roseateles sp. DAIF2]|uniref:hypothetical protein n=1 Tax=Roseateles sp. DAIF2 TaxID=2714952 RepID=UPI0018A2F609|nr:hypothetical protein [Roseateles sp. DAIF2]QPF74780.1 hypothetical protein G8A07_18870 [Roseateles sp. DAIF2]